MHWFLLRVHRYVGLGLAGFLVIIGLTGSVIVFFPELDRWVNSELITVEPRGKVIDELALRERLQAQDPRSHVYYIHFLNEPTEAFYAYTEGAIDPATGDPFHISYDEVMANPYSGERLGQRHWGDLSFERKDLITFLYFLHYSLVLPEALGETFMGIVALIFAFDCFVGFYLTLPRRVRRNDAESTRLVHFGRFLKKWKLSWLVERGAGTNRLVFDWHRASGLWVWPMLLVFATSGVALNLPGAYSAVMSKVLHYVDNDVAPELEEPLVAPAVSWTKAKELGEKYMAEAATAHGFTINRPTALIYRRQKGTYDYRVHSSRDLVRYGATSVMIDATTGALRSVEIPTGHLSGNTATNWLNALHQAMVFGLPYRIFVSAMGLLLTALAATGVLIWWRKRNQRLRSLRLRSVEGAQTRATADASVPDEAGA